MDNRLITFDLDNERSAQPKHEQLRVYPAKQMLSGDLQPGQKIPFLDNEEIILKLDLSKGETLAAPASKSRRKT